VAAPPDFEIGILREAPITMALETTPITTTASTADSILIEAKYRLTN
jgi:hypothetical protein